ncbi:MAG: Tll0287-like domain-containing protein [Nitrospiraceae bacterium]
MKTARRPMALWVSASVIMAAVGFWGLSLAARDSGGAGKIAPEKVAEYVHAVIEADRTIYTTHVVDRMQEKGITSAVEHWEQQNALPLPAQFLQYSGRVAAEKGSGIRYRLISLWPIYQRNAPATEFERKGLEAVLSHPQRPFTGTVTSGQKQFFQAIYADTAVAKACVTCHNAHPLSPKRDFKLNDVMGGIVITIPLQ